MAALKAELAGNLDESLDSINEGLAEAGLDPLSDEQLAEVRQRLDAMAEQMVAFQAEAEKPQPQLEDVLRQAGLPEERIDAVNAALELTPPDPADYGDALAWQAAVEAHVQAFSAIMQPPPSVQEQMRTVLRIQGPGGEQELEKLTGGPPPKAEELLVQAGMEPAAAARLLELLDGDIPSDLRALSEFGKKLEEEVGFAPGSVSGRIDAVRQMLKEAGLEEDEPAQEASPFSDRPREEAAAQEGPDAANGQSEAGAETSDGRDIASGENSADAASRLEGQAKQDGQAKANFGPGGRPADRQGV
ncbi:MAG: hypothetical protein Q4F27_04730, partial [Desulfovibrionaceae bacterium]|nr:hypothetical protein [Desulfovibrionaceae bacterium]